MREPSFCLFNLGVYFGIPFINRTQKRTSNFITLRADLVILFSTIYVLCRVSSHAPVNPEREPAPTSPVGPAVNGIDPLVGVVLVAAASGAGRTSGVSTMGSGFTGVLSPELEAALPDTSNLLK